MGLRTAHMAEASLSELREETAQHLGSPGTTWGSGNGARACGGGGCPGRGGRRPGSTRTQGQVSGRRGRSPRRSGAPWGSPPGQTPWPGGRPPPQPSVPGAGPAGCQRVGRGAGGPPAERAGPPGPRAPISSGPLRAAPRVPPRPLPTSIPQGYRNWLGLKSPKGSNSDGGSPRLSAPRLSGSVVWRLASSF